MKAKIEHSELEQLQQEIARLRGYIEALQTQLKVESLRSDERRVTIELLSGQLLERDEEIATLRDECAWRRSTDESAQNEVQAAQNEIRWLRNQLDDLRHEDAVIKETRLWRLGQRYWSLKKRTSGMLRRAPR